MEVNSLVGYPQIILQLMERIESLERRIDTIQYTNLRRDINVKNRTKIIDEICKEEWKQDGK